MKTTPWRPWALAFFLGTSLASAEQCRLQYKQPTTVSAGANVIPYSSGSASSSLPTPASATQSGSTSTPSATPFNYGNQTIRGVNLGGWFVLEPWITPSIFENTNNDNVVDEYTFGSLQDYGQALAVLEEHWDTWITEDDFAAINAAGLNHVRIPLGYWSVPMTSSDTNSGTSVSPYIPGAWQYLLRALNWAKTHDVHVILDLHGAPGSQNGYDNSGQRTSNPQWGSNATDVARTVDTVKYIAQHIGGMIDVLELLNEAAGFTSSAWAAVIRQFFQDGYDAVREVAPSSMKIMIGDAFLTVDAWTNFLTAPNGTGVMMDYHEYQIFSDDELSRSLDEHVSFACTHIPDLTSFAHSNLWTVLGEWSNAPTDCAQWLNGRGVGARWDGTIAANSQYFGSCNGWTGSSSNFSDEYKTFLRKYWEVQVEVGEAVQGWVFWTWKAENADEWSYQKGLEGGWIPSDPTDKLYPNTCS
ncbi:glycoside hydrolase [Armillaria solidipes]|uniref:Glycoside hydrolase n=1 Tax=Armillaria solidipes TaxID=1076256 RepID=A0A2H3C188_9AGAR|nr:glycoside hydrolase [Armillaria solidipes]